MPQYSPKPEFGKSIGTGRIDPQEENQKKAGVTTGLDAKYDDSLFLVQMTVFRRRDRHPFAAFPVFGFAQATDFLDDFLRGCFLLRFLLGHCQISSMKDERYITKVPLDVKTCQQKIFMNLKNKRRHDPVPSSSIPIDIDADGRRPPRRRWSAALESVSRGPEKDLKSGPNHRTFPPG
ncbi:MAG: hypothetical protein GYA46_12380 [candidate division Zixibacteria bacterium]|nr:hypothetical protein [candidate division Zixibacteria bacterium]